MNLFSLLRLRKNKKFSKIAKAKILICTIIVISDCTMHIDDSHEKKIE